MSKKVKLEIEIPEKMYKALVYYAKQTIHWAGNDLESRAVVGLATEAVMDFLECEHRSGFPRAQDTLENELKNYYEVI